MAGLQTCRRKTFAVKLPLRQLSSASRRSLSPPRLLYLVPSSKQMPLADAHACSRALCVIQIPCFSVWLYTATCTHACFLQRLSQFTHTHAAHANNKPFFVSSVNKSAICQPHIAPVLNHRSPPPGPLVPYEYLSRRHPPSDRARSIHLNPPGARKKTSSLSF